MTPHKHAEIIKAWADGATIEVKKPDGWEIRFNPLWYPDDEYRVRPAPIPDFVKPVFVMNAIDGVYMCEGFHEIPNVEFIFDGATGKLKSVKMLDI